MTTQKFIKNHPSIIRADDIRNICKPLNLLNINYFSHVHVDKDQKLSALASVPGFFELYFQKGYHQFDLHMANEQSSERYILWDLLQRKKQSYAMHADFMSFNRGHTFSIVINNQHTKDCYHFATAVGNETMNGIYLQIIPQLKQFINYFNDQVSQSKELSAAYSQKIQLQNVGGYLTTDEPASLAAFLEQIQSRRTFASNHERYLTQRESECLFWLAKGKTMAEAAIILNINVRTVKAHVNAAKAKLDCQNQFQLGVNYGKLLVSN